MKVLVDAMYDDLEIKLRLLGYGAESVKKLSTKESNLEMTLTSFNMRKKRKWVLSLTIRKAAKRVKKMVVAYGHRYLEKMSLGKDCYYKSLLNAVLQKKNF